MWTVLQLLGALIVIAGVAWIYPPAAVILAGLAVGFVGLMGED